MSAHGGDARRTRRVYPCVRLSVALLLAAPTVLAAQHLTPVQRLSAPVAAYTPWSAGDNGRATLVAPPRSHEPSAIIARASLAWVSGDVRQAKPPSRLRVIGGGILGGVGGYLIGNAMTCHSSPQPAGTLDLTCDQSPTDYRIPLTLVGAAIGSFFGWRWR